MSDTRRTIHNHLSGSAFTLPFILEYFGQLDELLKWWQETGFPLLSSATTVSQREWEALLDKINAIWTNAPIKSVFYLHAYVVEKGIASLLAQVQADGGFTDDTREWFTNIHTQFGGGSLSIKYNDCTDRLRSIELIDKMVTVAVEAQDEEMLEAIARLRFTSNDESAVHLYVQHHKCW